MVCELGVSEEDYEESEENAPKVLVAGHACADENVVVEEGGDMGYESRLELALKDVARRNEEILHQRSSAVRSVGESLNAPCESPQLRSGSP